VIEFVLNGRPEQLKEANPNLTILDWLRTQKRLLGTKEGCASGDCGACTVIIGSLTSGGRVRYESVNSCISLLGSLHGKHLITVDAFQSEPGHPVQDAMIAHHGAQCGFCTPGIVMSLIALHARDDLPTKDRETIVEALSGNLCRCTGYRPIIDAGKEAVVKSWTPDAETHPAASLCNSADSSLLSDIATGPTGFENADGLRFDSPSSLAELKQLLADAPDARLVAGSTDLALEITQQLKTLKHLISVERVQELKGCQEENGHLVIGAGCTYIDMHQAISHHWPDFSPMLKRLGSLQIRNRGTLGGNIANASPIGDMPPPLIALNATLVLDGGDGQRMMPLEAFFLDYKQTALRPGEFVHSVRIPLPKPSERLFMYKISKRLDDDISAVLGAFNITVEDGVVTDCRLAYGGMAAIPKRATNTEAALKGQPWTEDSVDAAITHLPEDFTPMSDARASAAYRLEVAGNLLVRALMISEAGDDVPMTVTTYGHTHP